MNGLRRFFILLTGVLALSASGCTPLAPVGAIGGDEANGGALSGDLDELLVVPHRSLYSISDVLVRGSDFSAFAHYVNNSLTRIPPGAVDIGIIENLNAPGEITLFPAGDNPCFMSSGMKGVVVFYNNISARYTVQVVDPYDIGIQPGSGGIGGDGGSGINIEWSE